ncbi:alkaline phosphatase D family protein [Amycolatopsis decaplanina]|uniref:alkaline phosphatase D family protein n=1 Tax=Amycolatopsis decaplanina TaxID=208441 RepID=UPI001F366F57|nr:alkaline phosphatase D family protein [Amycolatopsis decaplanina]
MPENAGFAHVVARGHVRTGRTRTAPSHDEDVASLRFGVVSCANWAVGHFAPLWLLAGRDDLDAFIHLGDYLCEGNPNPAGDLRPSVPPNELIDLRTCRTRQPARWRRPTTRSSASRRGPARAPATAVRTAHPSGRRQGSLGCAVRTAGRAPIYWPCPGCPGQGRYSSAGRASVL